MIRDLLFSGIGTVAFAILFSVPRSLYLWCGISGAAGFLVYDFCRAMDVSAAMATFFATLLVVFLSRALAVIKKAPATIFMITGIFPLVPGAGVYWTAYHVVMGELGLALSSGFEAVKAAVAIVLGIVIIFEIPNRFFHIRDMHSGGRRHAGDCDHS